MGNGQDDSARFWTGGNSAIIKLSDIILLHSPLTKPVSTVSIKTVYFIILKLIVQVFKIFQKKYA